MQLRTYETFLHDAIHFDFFHNSSAIRLFTSNHFSIVHDFACTADWVNYAWFSINTKTTSVPTRSIAGSYSIKLYIYPAVVTL